MTAPKRLGVVSLILALGALGLAGWTWTAVRHSDTTTQLESTEQDKAQLETEAETAADQVLALCAGNGKVALKLRQAGVCADSQRLRTITREGKQGKPGRPPTDAEIALAVASYCSGRVCAPSEAEIAASLRAYCDARDDCLGERGRDGDDGADGRPPTRAEIDAGVARYCAERNECRGADGQDGTDGTDGRNGQDGQDGTDGTDGQNGKPPAAWTWTDPGPPERTYRCTRNPGSSDDRPTYTCEAQEPQDGG